MGLFGFGRKKKDEEYRTISSSPFGFKKKLSKEAKRAKKKGYIIESTSYSTGLFGLTDHAVLKLKKDEKKKRGWFR